eukprot:30943-Pelagococcus_subviridis.AAC.12
MASRPLFSSLSFMSASHASSFPADEGGQRTRQPERVEAVVPRDVVGVHEEQLRGVERRLPRLLHARGLRDEDDGADEPPKQRRNLLKVVDGRTGDLRVEEEGRPLDVLADEKPQRGEHRDAPVRDLHVRVSLRLGLLDVVEEPERVDAVRERADAADDAGVHRVRERGERLSGRRGRLGDDARAARGGGGRDAGDARGGGGVAERGGAHHRRGGVRAEARAGRAVRSRATACARVR